ncbi:MAG TPA: hypothetical protein VHA56_16335 [Mucilaginibacter sp.]|nr:hypothetical protein [Mucilaginibacter sp.]
MALHIGKEIERKFQESGFKIGYFAEQINTGERNVYSIFSRKDISADMLARISKTLDFNFFRLYEQNLPSLANDPQVQYEKVSSQITVGINITALPGIFYENFGSLMRELVTQGKKYGFTIK